MDHAAGASYGLWALVLINSAVFIIFAFSFTKPQTKRDWRTFGAFSAFIVALFAEMYGPVWDTYATNVPAFIPKFSSSQP